MESNQGVAYIGPGKVELQGIDFPVLALGPAAVTMAWY